MGRKSKPGRVRIAASGPKIRAWHLDVLSDGADRGGRYEVIRAEAVIEIIEEHNSRRDVRLAVPSLGEVEGNKTLRARGWSIKTTETTCDDFMQRVS